jgi:hypothetical protein
MNQETEDILTFIIGDDNLLELWDVAVYNPDKEDTFFESLLEKMPNITDEGLESILEEIWNVRDDLTVPDISEGDGY